MTDMQAQGIQGNDQAAARRQQAMEAMRQAQRDACRIKPDTETDPTRNAARQEVDPTTQADTRRNANAADAQRSQDVGTARRPDSAAEVDTNNRAGGQRNLHRGHRGEDVRQLQRQLNQNGARLAEDGRFGPLTQAALRDFQRQRGVRDDGVAGPATRQALDGNATGSTQRVQPGQEPGGRPQQGGDIRNPQRAGPRDVQNDPQAQPGNPANRTATFDRISNRGARNQMASGRITVNGNTYNFNSGGFGRGNLPAGDYQISNLRNTNQAGMVRDGVGYKADISNAYDSRVGGTRSLLRIHPDGGNAGTQGCIGIVGNRAVQEQFRRDLAAELQRNGGRFTLRVG